MQRGTGDRMVITASLYPHPWEVDKPSNLLLRWSHPFSSTMLRQREPTRILARETNISLFFLFWARKNEKYRIQFTHSSPLLPFSRKKSRLCPACIYTSYIIFAPPLVDSKIQNIHRVSCWFSTPSTLSPTALLFLSIRTDSRHHLEEKLGVEKTFPQFFC